MWRFGLLLMAGVLWAVGASAQGPPSTAHTPHWTDVRALASGPVDWVATGAGALAFGRGGEVFLAPRLDPSRPQAHFRPFSPVSGALFLGDRLYLFAEGRGLLALTLPLSAPRPLPDLLPVPELHGPFAAAGGALLFADAPFAFTVSLEVEHACALDGDGRCCLDHGGRRDWPSPSADLLAPLDRELVALVLLPGDGFIGADREGGLRLFTPGTGPSGRPLPAGPSGSVDALALVGGRFLLAGSETGVRVFDLAALLSAPPSPGGLVPPAAVLPLPCRALATEGRAVYIAGPQGLTRATLVTPQAITVNVSVGNFFFSPASVTLTQGDSVKWTRSAGTHSTTSGVDCGFADNRWNAPIALSTPSFTRVFNDPAGSYPYFCDVHCAPMTGGITLSAAGAARPVPYSVTPLRATATNLGADAALTWDAVTCASTGYHLIFGYGSDLASAMGPSPQAGDVAGAVCGLGTGGSYSWTGVPDPTSDASRFLWFLVVGDDGASKEGSWGTSSSGAQRGGTVTSATCGLTSKETATTCP